MAHFAQLDENNVVLQVIVIDNKDTADANGVEKEHIGAAFCEKLLGGTWKQTSYNGNIRKHYAGIGMKYHADIDAFVTPKPYASWVLNNTTAHTKHQLLCLLMLITKLVSIILGMKIQHLGIKRIIRNCLI
jgi:hypothetical protein